MIFLTRRGVVVDVARTRAYGVVLACAGATTGLVGDDARAAPPKVQAVAAAEPRPPYLRRTVMTSPRFLDHGVLGVTVAGGAPAWYRLGLGLGLFDHLTLGATATWFPYDERPQWSPIAAVAFYRGPRIETGLTYQQGLHRPPDLDRDAETEAFRQRTHWLMASMTANVAWVAGGFDLGWVRGREAHVAMLLADPTSKAYVVRDHVAVGLHLRAGTRRFGFTAQVRWPHPSAELAFDLRFGLFERRDEARWLAY